MKEYVENTKKYVDILDLALPYRLRDLEKFQSLPPYRLWNLEKFCAFLPHIDSGTWKNSELSQKHET